MLLASTSCASSSSSLSVASEVTSAPFWASCSWYKRSFKSTIGSQQHFSKSMLPWKHCKMTGKEKRVRETLIEAIFARRFSSIWPLAMWNGRSKTSCNKHKINCYLSSFPESGQQFSQLVYLELASKIPFFHQKEIVKGHSPVFHCLSKVALRNHLEHSENRAYPPVITTRQISRSF